MFEEKNRNDLYVDLYLNNLYIYEFCIKMRIYIYIILCLEDVIIFLENLVLKNFLIINASSNF